MGAAIGAAVAASACCVLPLLLISLGLGGAWIGSLTALAPYQPIFIGIALVALGYAAFREYQFTQRADCACEGAFSPAIRRSLLGLGTVAVVVLVTSSWLIADSPASTSTGTPEQITTEQAATPIPDTAERTLLSVENMTCAACAPSLEQTLAQTRGVYNADVSYDPPRAIVHFDADVVSINELTEATANIGFPSTPASDTP